MHSELTCILKHMEQLNSVPKDISTLRNSVESSQGVVGTHCVAMKTDEASMAGDIHLTWFNLFMFLKRIYWNWFRVKESC